MRQRTDEEVIARTPIEVMLGETKYKIKILSIGKAREWRALFVSTIGEVSKSLNIDATPENLGTGLTAAMIKFPDKLLDLVCAYAPDLPRNTIEAEATDEQITSAYGRIIGIACPMMGSLATSRKMISQ
jgi:hypothetical protein